MTDRYIALDHAKRHANRWLDSLPTRPVPPQASAAEVTEALGTELPAGPTPANEVIDLLASACEPGLTAMPSGRFYGFVIGGTHPAALAADWLVSAWDQNAVLRAVSPAHAAVEDVTSAWLLDLLGLPETSGVGFVTGATMSNFTCLAAARDAVLRQHGWDVAAHGLSGSPRVRVLVGAQRHDTVDLALRYLGLGAPEPVSADDQGRIDPGALADALGQIPQGTPSIVVLQAGNLHSGAFDPFAEAIAVAHRARRLGAHRRRVRPVRRRLPGDQAPHRRLRPGRLVDHRRAQDPQRPLRLRHRDRRRPRRAARRDDDGRHGLLHHGRRGRLVRHRPGELQARPRDPGLGASCAPSAVRAWRTWSTASAATRRRSPAASRPSTAPRSRTTWSSPRYRRASARTSARRR